jgi:O-antigen/teichoic acid export membrane protein
MRLNSNNLWSLVEGVSSAIFQLCIIALISRYSGLSDVGRYGFVLAISAPVFMLVNMRLRFVYVSGRPECKDAFFSCFALRVITSTIAASLIIISTWVISPDIALILTAVTLYKYFESLSDFIYSLFHRRGEMIYIARSSVVSVLLSVVGVWFAFEMGCSLVVALFLTALVKMTVFIVHDVRMAMVREEMLSVGSIKFNWINKVVMSLFPLGLLALLSSFSFNAPRLLLGWSGDMRAAGIYTGLSHLVMGGAIVVNAFAFPLLRELGESYANSELNVTQAVVHKLMYICAILGIVSVAFVYIFGEEILYILYGSSFEDNWSAFVLMMLVGSLYYQVQVINHVGTSVGYYKQTVIWQGVSLLAIVTSLLLLVPEYGVMGASIAWGLGLAVQIVLFLRSKTTMLSLSKASAN